MRSLAALALFALATSLAAAENHLAGEASPYLRAHATNPVDWWPWCDEAFAKAKAEDKPVLLSIGYATCHWCHVMAQESFEDAEVAKCLNERFVSIKVDREELPEVDRVYVGFVAAQTGLAGWPLTVFLAPDRAPFIGGTYLPRERFLAALKVVSEQWTTNRQALLAHGQEAMERLKAAPVIGDAAGSARLLDAALSWYRRQFDTTDGGFGEAPKFPRPSTLRFLLTMRERPGVEDMLRQSLDALVRGGICDQLDGGFHRYTLDAAWRVPHFEKMLYDQAQLAGLLSEAGHAFPIQPTPEPGAPSWEMAGVSASSYMLGRLVRDDGAFAAAEDADSAPVAGAAAREGSAYLWTTAEIAAALAPMNAQAPVASKLVAAVFAARDEGNIPTMFDDRGDLRGRNVLRWAASPAVAGDELGLSKVEAWELFGQAFRLMRAARATRPTPPRDDQAVTGWNGLALSSLAAIAERCPDTAALAAAERAASCLVGRWTEERGLPRSSAGGPGTASDYAQAELGLLDLHAVDGDPRWLDWALTLQARLDRDFWDEGSGTYFDGLADPRLPARLRTDEDDPEPAANSCSAQSLLRLATITGDEGFEKRAQRLLTSYRGILARTPWQMPAMLTALAMAEAPRWRLLIVAEQRDAACTALLAASNRAWRPDLSRACVVISEASLARLAHYPELAAAKPLGGKATAYLCSGSVCLPPITDPEMLAEKLVMPRK